MRNLRVQSTGLCRHLPKGLHPQFSLALNSLSLYMSQQGIHCALNSVLDVLGDGLGWQCQHQQEMVVSQMPF